MGVKNSPPIAPLHPWVWPATPWQRIHVDFAGPFMNKTYLLVTYTHSKWPVIIKMNSTTTHCPENHYRAATKAIFCLWLAMAVGLRQWTTVYFRNFAQFMKSNGIKHIRCTPYHPACNGAVECLVQTFKKAMKTAKECGKDLQQGLSSFLLHTVLLLIQPPRTLQLNYS